MIELVAGNREVIGPWVLGQIRDNVNLNTDFNTIGIVRDGALIGGVIYHCYRSSDVVTDVEMVAAGVPGWLSKRSLKAIFGYPFADLGCTRVTVICSKKNKRARKMVEGLGYTLEGKVRRAMQDGADAMIYGMLKQECRWI